MIATSLGEPPILPATAWNSMPFIQAYSEVGHFTYLNQFCKLGPWTKSATKKTQNIKGASSSIYIGVLLTSTHEEIHNEYIKKQMHAHMYVYIQMETYIQTHTHLYSRIFYSKKTSRKS